MPLPPLIHKCIDVWQRLLFNDAVPIQRLADTPLQTDSVNCVIHVVSNVLRATTGQHGYANPDFKPRILRLLMWNAVVERTHDIEVQFHDDHDYPVAQPQSPRVRPCTLAASPPCSTCVGAQSSESITTPLKPPNTPITTIAHNPTLPLIIEPSLHLIPPPVTAPRVTHKRVSTDTLHNSDVCPRVSIHSAIPNDAYHQFLTFIAASNISDQPMEWDTARSLTASWIQAPALLEHAVCTALPLLACDEPVPDFSHLAPADAATTFMLPVILDYRFLCIWVTTSKCVVFASWYVVITKALRAFILAVTKSLLRLGTRRPKITFKETSRLPETFNHAYACHAMPSSTFLLRAS